MKIHQFAAGCSEARYLVALPGRLPRINRAAYVWSIFAEQARRLDGPLLPSGGGLRP